MNRNRFATIMIALLLSGCGAASAAETFVRQHTVCYTRYLYQNIRWSPDGTRIAFAEAEISGRQSPARFVRVMDPAGQNVTTIITSQMRIGGLTWSPDGKMLAVSMGDVYIIDVDTHAMVRVIRAGENSYIDLDWSPNGKTLLMSSDLGHYWELRTMPIPDISQGVNGEMLVPLEEIRTLPVKAVQGASPRWSPDGKRIAFITATHDGFAVVNADGSDTIYLETAPANLPDISWAPDGMSFLHSGGLGNPGSDQYDFRTGRDGGAPHDGYWADWSPDGKQIAYAKEDSIGVSQIYLVNADGNNVRQITQRTAPSMCLH